MNSALPTRRLSILFLVSFVVTSCFSSFSCGQEQLSLKNGDLEKLNDDKLPTDWKLFGRTESEWNEAGVRYSSDNQNPFGGKNSLLIDASELKLNMVDAWQHFSASDYAGKRVRLSGMIRVVGTDQDEDERENADQEADDDEEEDNADEVDEQTQRSGTGCLSVRMYRTDPLGYYRTIANEIALRRAKENDKWNRCSIVIDVPKNAEIIEIGLHSFGKTKAWFDDIALEVVGNDLELTSPAMFDGPQPFFTWWLILPAIAMTIFAVSFTRPSPLQRFAIRFSLSYWISYYFTSWLGLLRFTEIDLSDYYRIIPGYVNWFTWNLFQTDVFPMSTGSGDALYNYAHLLAIFVLSVGVAIVWSLLDWRKTDHVWAKDLLRSLLRYSLAMILLSYGIGKLNPEFSQFQAPSFYRLQNTIGESSPMGLLWTFMGASQPYTIFAGVGEVLAAVLLIWRRTTIIGAFVAIGVMTNVVMLNFCYDVPVKIFSTHLLLTAALIVAPDFSRIVNVFFMHGKQEQVDLTPPFVAPWSKWYYRGFKFALVVVAIVLPVYETVESWNSSKKPMFFADYAVEEHHSPLLVAEQASTGAESGSGLDQNQSMRFRFARLPFKMDEEQETSYTDVVSITSGKGMQSSATVRFDSEQMEMEVVEFDGRQKVLPDKFKIQIVDAANIELTSLLDDDSSWRLQLRRQKGDFLLSSRGFRWVNQRPFNR